jgi:hypothetical protein
MIFWLVLKLEFSYRVIINILKDFGFFFRGFFWRLYNFCIGEFFLSLHNSSFVLRYFLINVNGKATIWHLVGSGFQGRVERDIVMVLALHAHLQKLGPKSLVSLHSRDSFHMWCLLLLLLWEHSFLGHQSLKDLSIYLLGLHHACMLPTMLFLHHACYPPCVYNLVCWIFIILNCGCHFKGQSHYAMNRLFTL